jgi:hypothetical protein
LKFACILVVKVQMTKVSLKIIFAQLVMLLLFLTSAMAQENITFALTNTKDKIGQSIEAEILRATPLSKSNKDIELPSFQNTLTQILAKQNRKKDDLCDEKDVVAERILKDYGSIFSSSADVEKFQKQIGIAKSEIAGTNIELQPFAMEALLKAREEARKSGLNITPRDGAIAGRRGFDETLRLWNSRFFPACDYWTKNGRLSEEQSAKLKSLPIKEQVREVLELEKQGIYFNSSFNNSILYSVAAPGTSQHLALLAFDVVEYSDERVRNILAKHGWYRTVRNDQPHFTFLGHKEKELPKFGLREVKTASGKFWIPNIK